MVLLISVHFVHDSGQKLLNGHGVPVDEARAMKWFRLELVAVKRVLQYLIFREASLSIEKYNQNYNLQYSFYAKYKTVFAIICIATGVNSFKRVIMHLTSCIMFDLVVYIIS